MNGTSKTAHSPSEIRETLNKHILVDGFHIIQDLEKSNGSYIYDSATHRNILDFYTSFATCPIGYNHPKMIDTKTKERLLPSAINKVANSDIYTVEYAEFVEKFSSTLPEQLRSHLFFVEGGSIAVENALKTAFDWKVRKNLKEGKGEKGTKIIHFKEAFHGRSGYALSLTNTDPNKVLYFPKFNWPRIINPKLKFSHGEVTEETLKEVMKVEQEAITQIEQAVADNPDDIAALIIEPIQGEGGDNHFRKEFLQELRKLADKLDFLLIFDEVQAGFGTTGKWWAFQHFDVIPDVLAFGKKTQVCGIAGGPRLNEVPSVFHVSSRINSTWGGNLVDMVRCTRIIEIIKEENLIENSAKSGQRLLERFYALEKKFPGQFTNSRGRGMFCAFDLPNTELRNKAIRSMEHYNLMCLTSGSRSIRCRPPISLSLAEVDEAADKIEKALNELFHPQEGQ